MNKKLIFLILCLPLLLMLSLYSVSQTVKLAVGLPVSKIEILGEQIVYMDIDKTNRYAIDYVIYPTSAKNQNVNFSAEPVGNAPLADLEFVDGYLIANSSQAQSEHRIFPQAPRQEQCFLGYSDRMNLVSSQTAYQLPLAPSPRAPPPRRSSPLRYHQCYRRC